MRDVFSFVGMRICSFGFPWQDYALSWTTLLGQPRNECKIEDCQCIGTLLWGKHAFNRSWHFSTSDNKRITLKKRLARRPRHAHLDDRFIQQPIWLRVLTESMLSVFAIFNIHILPIYIVIRTCRITFAVRKKAVHSNEKTSVVLEHSCG